MEQTRTDRQPSMARQDVDYQVPASDGELLVSPAPAYWWQLLRENRELVCATASRPGPAGLTWGEISTAVRRRAFGLASRYIRLLGDDDERVIAAGTTDFCTVPLLATGHQPLFYHPGIWAKNVALSLAAEDLRRVEGITPLLINLVVDSDAAEGLVVAVPECSPGNGGPGWGVVKHPVPVERQLPFESLPLPRAEVLTGWLERVDRSLASVNQPDLATRWQAARNLIVTAARGCVSVGEHTSDRWTVAEWTTTVRRQWERGLEQDLPRYLDLPISWLARTPEFFWYALDIFSRAEMFNAVYNRELAEYRRSRRIRSRANPFPDLAAGPDFWELPFWLLAPITAGHSGRPRTPLACRRLAGGDILVYPLGAAAEAEGVGVRLPAPPGSGVAKPDDWKRWREGAWDLWRASGWDLRPKALTLTLFVRMTLADLFIHGVGGGRYDRVTEAVARSYYGVPLPGGAVVSFTAHLPLPVDKGAAERLRLLRARRRELEQNPQRHLDLLSDPQIREKAIVLARTKEELIARLAVAARQEKKPLAQQLSRVTGELAELFTPELAELDAEIARLEIRAREEEVGSFREYPFFLYDPAGVYAQIKAEWEKLRMKPDSTGSGPVEWPADEST